MKLFKIKAKQKALKLYRARAFCGDTVVILSAFDKERLESTSCEYARHGYIITDIKPHSLTVYRDEIYDLEKVYINTLARKEIKS